MYWLRHFWTCPLKPLNGIQWNLTGSTISKSSTKFVFFRDLSKRWHTVLRCTICGLWAPCFLITLQNHVWTIWKKSLVYYLSGNSVCFSVCSHTLLSKLLQEIYVVLIFVSREAWRHIGITSSVVCTSVCHTPIAMFRMRHMHSSECCHYFLSLLNGIWGYLCPVCRIT